MNQTEINQIITEQVMGECYHEKIEETGLYDRYYVCSCGKKIKPAMYRYHGNNSDFSQWPDWGRCLEKIQTEKWWEDIAYYTHRGSGYGEGDSEKFNEDLLNPTTGSLSIAEFVKDREVK